jgi:hypothetical protein
MNAYRPDNPIFESPDLDQLYTELADNESFYLRAPVDTQDVIQIGRHSGKERLLFVQRQSGSLIISREDSREIQVAINHDPDKIESLSSIKTLVFAYPVKRLVFLEHPNGWNVSGEETRVTTGLQGERDIQELASKIGSYGNAHLRKSLPPEQQTIYN